MIFQSCTEKISKKSQEEITISKDSIHVKLNHEKGNDTEEILREPLKVKDSTPIHVFKTGETLWNLSRTYYGNRHYSSILSIYNEIDNVNTIKDGTQIKIPSLSILLKDSKLGLSPIIQNEIEKILDARKLFMKHEKTLRDLRDHVEGRTQLDLPENVEDDIKTATGLIDETIASLKIPKSDSIKAPLKMIGQLKSVSANLKNLSEGKHDGDYGYDIDMVHQRLINAIENAIFWAKNISK